MKLGTFPTTPLLRTYAARRETSPAPGSERKVATTNWPSGNALIGPRVDRPPPLAEERWQHREPDRRQRHAQGDKTAEPERRPLEQAVARKPLRARLLAATSCRARDDLSPRRTAVATYPAEAGDDCYRAAERREYNRVHDQPDKQHGDPDREADRPDRGSGRGILPTLLPRLHQSTRMAKTSSASSSPASSATSAWSSVVLI